ncbi:glycoside hydrolase family 35 protein [Streptomyces baarnensis]|uniref:glycoside hydrolase family 35 protein n=1 Tax=Streptomyces TaxID=1883 RepID=UPI0029BE005E|nr:glycoside hydrolase family 35 protein [Streptomyces sp. ME02-6979.5a]MDX3342634.1 beta-galactosidase [Streptomyces sp. ME02-6979.5a]
MPELSITDDGFRLDGEPFRIISGSLHYFRVHPEQWADRLRKARLMGLNTVDVYVPWNLHQPDRDGPLVRDGGLDLPRFLDLAAAEGLHVLLRPGPYICAEWEAGGLPAWLLADPDVRLRTSDPRYQEPVERYFELLLAQVRPHLASAGGPVVAVQVENEYGASGRGDRAHLDHLVTLLRKGGVDVPLFTSDQAGDLADGGLPGVLRTVNFSRGAAARLRTLREHQPQGPLMCGEFWSGWFDRWGSGHNRRRDTEVRDTLEEILAAGASVNIYMFHGGTNFGFTNGANDKGHYRPTVTSYDYDAPLDEAGDPTAKYHLFRETIAAHAAVPSEPVPERAPKLRLRDIRLPRRASLLAQAGRLGAARRSDRPLTMEELGQAFGYVLYETALPAAGDGVLRIARTHDRAQVFVDGQPVGTLVRENREQALSLRSPAAGARLTVLVENQGRVNYGAGLHDWKGIAGPVTFGGEHLSGWTCTPLPLDDPDALSFSSGAVAAGPAFFRGTVRVETPADTYLHLPGWTKGNAWVNGFALGRYWSRGPQQSLYVPGPVLRRGDNEIVVLELQGCADDVVHFEDVPDLGPAE